MIPANFRFYRAADGQAGPPWVCIIYLQKDGSLVAHQFGETYEDARDRATKWWTKHSAKYEERIDKRNTKNPLARLAKNQDRISVMIAEITSDKG